MTLECSYPNRTSMTPPPYSRLREHCRRDGRKAVRTRGLGNLLWNGIFWTALGCYISRTPVWIVEVIIKKKLSEQYSYNELNLNPKKILNWSTGMKRRHKNGDKISKATNTKLMKAINIKQHVLGVNHNVPITILNINSINVWIQSLPE